MAPETNNIITIKDERLMGTHLIIMDFTTTSVGHFMSHFTKSSFSSNLLMQVPKR